MESPADFNDKILKENRLTVEELKKYKGFEDMSDADCIEYIYSIEQFCTIAFELYKNRNLNSNE